MKHFALKQQNKFFLAILLMLSFSMIGIAGSSSVGGVEVCVQLKDGGKMITTKTDNTGKFTFSGLAPGTYKLMVRCADGACVNQIYAPRDAASGQASGKTSAPRDAATGQSSGKRMATSGDVTCHWDLKTNTKREAGSGMATGKRQHQPIRITKEWTQVTVFVAESSNSSIEGEITQ